MSSQKRHQRGFERVGQVRAEELGLPQRKTRELTLAALWRKAAGAAIADRVAHVRVARGTLEVHMDPVHASWAPTVAELLPQIAGRLARDHPGLKLRRARLLAEPPVSRFPDVVVSAAPPEGDTATRVEPSPRRRPVDGGSGISSPSGASARLRELASRYLARTSHRGSS